nr:MAG TPA: hypothetical protein [Caudoviricetes sp.]
MCRSCSTFKALLYKASVQGNNIYILNKIYKK